MTELAWLGDIGKWVGGAAAGWFSRIAAESGKRRVLRRGLYKEMSYNAAMLFAMTKDGQRSDDDKFVQGVVRGSLRKSYFEQARLDRAAFDALRESYAIEDVYEGFDWIAGDIRSYPPGVVHSRMRGALNRIRRHISAKELSKRLLVRMAPTTHRTGVAKMIAEAPN